MSIVKILKHRNSAVKALTRVGVPAELHEFFITEGVQRHYIVDIEKAEEHMRRLTATGAPEEG